MSVTFFNYRRAREAEKAKLIEAQKLEPTKVVEPIEIEETTESKKSASNDYCCCAINQDDFIPVETKAFLNGETDELPQNAQEISIEEAETLEAQATKPKKKTDAEKLKRKK